MTKAKQSASKTKVVPVIITGEQTPAQALARAALSPSVNAGLVVDAYLGNIGGKDVETKELILALRETTASVKSGDLAVLEAMLVSQATALQTMFTNLARRAAIQEQLPHYEAFMGMALKAQAQSRSTIQAVIELKFPRQATFVKQANIANGPQQVNNGAAAEPVPATHAGKTENAQNKLLEAEHGQCSGRVDTRAAQAAEHGDPAVATVDKIHRAKKP